MPIVLSDYAKSIKLEINLAPCSTLNIAECKLLLL